MEGTPKDSPVPVGLHPNRGSQDLFGGGKNIFHELFCDLLLNEVWNDKLSARHMGEESHESREPGMGLAGGDGGQKEKHC